MAAPISLQKKQADPEEALQARLEKVPVAHTEAILTALDVLQEAKDSGTLDLLRGLLSAREEITTTAAGFVNTPESIRAMRNLASLLKILGSVDLDVLHQLASELAQNARHPAALEKPPSLWAIIRKITGKDSRRALAGAVAFLEAFGRALVTKPAKH